jgi:hypothetical protein
MSCFSSAIYLTTVNAYLHKPLTTPSKESSAIHLQIVRHDYRSAFESWWFSLAVHSTTNCALSSPSTTLTTASSDIRHWGQQSTERKCHSGTVEMEFRPRVEVSYSICDCDLADHFLSLYPLSHNDRPNLFHVNLITSNTVNINNVHRSSPIRMSPFLLVLISDKTSIPLQPKMGPLWDFPSRDNMGNSNGCPTIPK